VRKRFIIMALGFVVVAMAYYVASPLIAAYQLRQAIKAGDADIVSSMINWRSLRASVRRTVARNAKLLPIARDAAQQASQSWWQRLRSAFGHSMLDRFVERYITPEGLTELYRTKTKWHERSHRARPSSPTAHASQAGHLPVQWTKTWRRVKSAVFVSPFLFELDIQDRHKPNRLIKSVFQLSGIRWNGLNWKLIGLSIQTVQFKTPKLARLNGF